MIQRTHTCGDLSVKDAGKIVCLNGWVKSWRDHGGLIFIDLRDRYGVTQLVFNPEIKSDVYEQARALRAEFVISVKGEVSLRPEGTVNRNLITGEIEIICVELEILNPSMTPPFEIIDELDIHEELKLQYRYLDLRRDTMQKNLLVRNRVYKIVRDYLYERNFILFHTFYYVKYFL